MKGRCCAGTNEAKWSETKWAETGWTGGRRTERKKRCRASRLVPAGANLAAQVQAAVQTAGPVWLAEADIEQCRKLFPAEYGYFLRLKAVPLGGTRNGQWRWGGGDEEYVEVRYAPESARRSLNARRCLVKRDAVSVVELCHLIDSLAREARQAGFLTGYCPTSYRRSGIPALVDSLNSVLAVHRAVCGRWAYRQNRAYAAFLRRVRATRKATLRKFRNEGFQAWLLQELRSRAAKRAAAETAGQGGNGYPRDWPDCLPLPFDDALDKLRTAEDSRNTPAGKRQPAGRRRAERRCG